MDKIPCGSDHPSFSGMQDRKLLRLYCMNGGHHLQLLSNGTVNGSRQENQHTNPKLSKPEVTVERKNSLGIMRKKPWEDQDSKRDPSSLGGVDEKRVLRIAAVSVGVVVIEGTEAKRFLAMSDAGKLYASISVTEENYFLEKLEENHYNTYQSKKYGPNWYVGLKKNGDPKQGPKTHIGQKAIFFLPRQVD